MAYYNQVFIVVVIVTIVFGLIFMISTMTSFKDNLISMRNSISHNQKTKTVADSRAPPSGEITITAKRLKQYRQISKPDWESLVKLIIKFPLDHYWGSHATTILAAVIVTQGPIYELGMGLHSTPMLHNIAVLQNRFVLSCETNKAWLGKFIHFNDSAVHKLYHVNINGPSGVNEWDKYGNDRDWGVVFVDHGQSLRRRVDIGRFMDKTDIIIVHDNQDKGYYYAPALAKLNFTFTDKKLTTWTMVASRRDKKLVEQAAQLIKWAHEMPGAHPKAG